MSEVFSKITGNRVAGFVVFATLGAAALSGCGGPHQAFDKNTVYSNAREDIANIGSSSGIISLTVEKVTIAVDGAKVREAPQTGMSNTPETQDYNVCGKLNSQTIDGGAVGLEILVTGAYSPEGVWVSIQPNRLPGNVCSDDAASWTHESNVSVVVDGQAYTGEDLQQLQIDASLGKTPFPATIVG